MAAADANDLTLSLHDALPIFGGDGNDTFVWNPGDGSDTVEGQGGTDTLLFNGANIAERIRSEERRVGKECRPQIARETKKKNGIEQVNLTARGGTDTSNGSQLRGHYVL